MDHRVTNGPKSTRTRRARDVVRWVPLVPDDEISETEPGKVLYERTKTAASKNDTVQLARSRPRTRPIRLGPTRLWNSAASATSRASASWRVRKGGEQGLDGANEVR